MTRIILSSLIILSLAACGGNEPQGKTTSRINAIDVEPGTISDSMIILDDAISDGTAVDNSVPDDGTVQPKKADEESKAADEEKTDAATANTDTAPAPAVKKAVTPAD
jgi:hypothetical protein